MMIMKYKYFLILTAVLLPIVAFAQIPPRDAFGVVALVAGWISRIIPALLGFILLIIFWNLGQFILHSGEERERDKYKQFMVWGVIGMFLILSFWGIVYAITRSFFQSTTNPVLGNPGYVDKNGVPVF
jgi:membrane protease YdiL (CAAX protease family)